MIRVPGEVVVSFMDTDVSYLPKKNPTFAHANAAPQDLSAVKTDTLKVLSLLGYPSMQALPMGTFSNARADTTTANEVAIYLAGNAPAPSDPSASHASDLFVSAGLAGDIAPLGAVVGALASNSAYETRDPRAEESTVLCFKPVAEHDPSSALASCMQDITTHITSSFTMQEPLFLFANYLQYKVSFPLSSGATAINRLGVYRHMSDYALGFAPVDRGGYKAHMFKVSLLTIYDRSDDAVLYRAEDLGAVFAKNKPDSLVYLLTASPTQKAQDAFEPVGIY